MKRTEQTNFHLVTIIKLYLLDRLESSAFRERRDIFVSLRAVVCFLLK